MFSIKKQLLFLNINLKNEFKTEINFEIEVLIVPTIYTWNFDGGVLYKMFMTT